MDNNAGTETKQNENAKWSRKGTHYWHCIMKSSRRRITVPNRPQGFQFPPSLLSNGSGISEMRWVECQVKKGEEVPFLMLLDTNQWHQMNSYWGINNRGTLQYTACKESALSLAVDQNCSVYSWLELCRSFIICMTWLWHSDTLPKLPLRNSGLQNNGFTFWWCGFQWFYILTRIKIHCN